MLQLKWVPVSENLVSNTENIPVLQAVPPATYIRGHEINGSFFTDWEPNEEWPPFISTVNPQEHDLVSTVKHAVSSEVGFTTMLHGESGEHPESVDYVGFWIAKSEHDYAAVRDKLKEWVSSMQFNKWLSTKPTIAFKNSLADYDGTRAYVFTSDGSDYVEEEDHYGFLVKFIGRIEVLDSDIWDRPTSEYSGSSRYAREAVTTYAAPDDAKMYYKPSIIAVSDYPYLDKVFNTKGKIYKDGISSRYIKKRLY